MKAKKLLLMGLILGSVLGNAFGQTLFTYYADDLERQPGIIYVSKGFNTVIQFYDRLDAYTITRSEVVQVQELDPSTLWFYTVQSQGITGMTAVVNGRILQFTIVVRPGDHNRTYRVELSRSVYGPRSEGPREVPQQAPKGETREATPDTQTKPVKTAPAVNLRFSLESAGPRLVAVRFTAKNEGKEDIYLDVARLRITQGGSTVSYSITRTPARVRIGPGESQTGVLSIRPVSDAPIQITWRVVSASGGETTITYPVPLKDTAK